MLFKEKLTAEEEKYYIEKLQLGDIDARNKLIEHNLRLVANIAKRFRNTGHDYEDLISTGTIGLIKGIDTFKVDKKIKLCTYCARCIENEILMYIRKKGNNTKSLSYCSNECEDLSIEEMVQSSYNLEEECIENDTRNMIKYVLMMLPERERKILIYYIFYKKTQCEIAEELNIRQVTICRILKKIYKEIKPYFDDKKITDDELKKLKIAKRNYLKKSFKF